MTRQVFFTLGRKQMLSEIFSNLLNFTSNSTDFVSEVRVVGKRWIWSMYRHNLWSETRFPVASGRTLSSFTSACNSPSCVQRPMVTGNSIILFDCMSRCLKFVKHPMVSGKDLRILLETFKITRLLNSPIESGKAFKWHPAPNWPTIATLVKVKIHVQRPVFAYKI